MRPEPWSPGPADRCPVAVLAAHPDDETLGASAILGNAPGCAVLHLTDGAPSDARLRPAAFARDARGYALARRRELHGALAVAGVDPPRAHALGGPDQDAITEAVALARHLARLLDHLAPARLVTHAYEGGHPDHDAAALVARGALELLRRAGRAVPRLYEMALYHGACGRLATFEFIAAGAPARGTLEVRLDPAQRRRKVAMLAKHESQRALLDAWFPELEVERFRRAAPADFSRPPHEGTLWYERLGFALDGPRWRAVATAALAALARERLP